MSEKNSFSQEVDKICKGCRSFRQQCAFISTGKIFYIKKCPCPNCLVKAMCVVACDEYAELDDLISASDLYD